MLSGVFMSEIESIVAKGMCMSCGACSAAGYKLRPSKKTGMIYPVSTKKSNEEMALNVCPGKGYYIEGLTEETKNGVRHTSFELGRYLSIGAVRSSDPVLLANASSGGVMTAFSKFLLDTGVVSGIISTRMDYSSPEGPRPEPFIATNAKELMQGQGSKYCPVPLLTIGEKVNNFGGKLALIGTPCQIAGLKLLQQEGVAWAAKIILTMGNFCGGFRDYRETDRLIARSGFTPEDVVDFRYRGSGQPGFMSIKSDDGRLHRHAYPKYARATGIIKNFRCKTCVDATAELADFSFGDAWLKRFLETHKPWSIFITRNKSVLCHWEKFLLRSDIERKNITETEIIRSQYDNISTKKYRQECRKKLYSFVGVDVPNFGNYTGLKTGLILFELRVIVSQFFFVVLEKLGLYVWFARLFNRYPKDFK